MLSRSPSMERTWVSALAAVFGGTMIATQFAGGIWYGHIGEEDLIVYHFHSRRLLVGGSRLLVGLSVFVAATASVGRFGRGAWLASAVLLVERCVGFRQEVRLSHWYTAYPYLQIDKWASTVRTHVLVSRRDFFSTIRFTALTSPTTSDS